MKTTTLSVTSTKRTQLIPVTAAVADVIVKSGWNDGVVTIFVPHTTAGITINENADPDVVKDMESFFCDLVPRHDHFLHSEGNSDAHIKASLFGSSVQVVLRNSELWLGTWQGIFFCEFDGPRKREMYLAFQ